MDASPRSLLIQIVETYSPGVIDDRTRLRNLLDDYFQGNYRKERNTLIASLEEGIPHDLIQSRASVPLPSLIWKLTRRLTENRGISDDLAVWTVETWAQACHIPIEENKIKVTERNQTTSPTVSSKPSGPQAFITSHDVGNDAITVTAVPVGSDYIKFILDRHEEWKKDRSP